MRRKGIVALAGAAATIGAGLAAERAFVKRRRAADPEAGQAFGSRRGERSRYVDRPDGARLFVEEVGPESRRGVVFLHGSALRTDVWHYQMAGLGDHRLVFYDLRGHGRSQPKGDSDFSLRTLVDDLEAVIRDAGLDEVVVAGHSIGGMVALQMCCDRPELLDDPIKGIVLVNSTYGPGAETVIGGTAVARIERAMRKPFDYLGTKHEYLQRLRKIVKPSDTLFLAVAMAAFGPSPSASQVDFTYDMTADTKADVIFDLIKSYRDHDVGDRLGDITVPALVIGGTHDHLTVSDASEYMARHLPKAELKMFHRCGHMSMLERHREFNAVLTTFLDDTLGRTDKDDAHKKSKKANRRDDSQNERRGNG
jgi:pimeloyl-ACP methyl ester carboxylesterase